MPIAACPTEHQLLARARGEGSGREREGEGTEGTESARELDGVDAHLAECSECRIVVSELARVSRAASPASEVRSAAGHASTPNGPMRPSVLSGDIVDGKYRITGILGRGGMGLVLDATHEVLGSRVAIKVPALDLRDDSGARARLLREARVVARLEGEYVGRVLDAGILPGGFPFVVFEYLEGRTLAERLRDDGRLPASDAVDAIVEACAGLFAAHGAGVVHRDVKPSNLFEARRADGSATVRVIDFGIAKQYVDGETLTRSRMVLGTPAYMAPEQVLAQAVDARADVWALGMTLLELVTGRPPTAASFARLGEGAGALAREIQEVGASRREALAIARVIGQCLRDRAEDRFASVAALAHALAPVASGRGLTALRSMARGVGAVGAASPRMGMRRVPLAIALGAALVTLVAFGVLRTPRATPAAADDLHSARPDPVSVAPLTSAAGLLAAAVAAVPAAAQDLAETEAAGPPAPHPTPAPARHAPKPPAPVLPKADSAGVARPKPAEPPAPVAPRDTDGLGDRK